MNAILTTQRLTKYYVSWVLIDRLSMQVKEGKTFGFVGSHRLNSD